MIDENACLFYFNILHIASAQRLALAAGGRGETTPFYRNNFKSRKLPENAQTPTSRVHAVLGSVYICQTHISNTDL
jgi:hypothetical protein